MSSRERPFFNFFQIELSNHSRPTSFIASQELADHAENINLSAFLQTPTGRARVRAIRHITGEATASSSYCRVRHPGKSRRPGDRFEELLDDSPVLSGAAPLLPDQQRNRRVPLSKLQTFP